MKKIKPEVKIVGAGPGDAELLTLKAFKALKEAEVILYDALIGKEILTYANPDAVLVYVGKRAAKHSYSQEEIKELVAYAQARHVTIIPEIEMPGHSQAAIAAYPELGCSGEQVEVATKWGVFEDIYCTKDETFDFLELHLVITEHFLRGIVTLQGFQTLETYKNQLQIQTVDHEKND